LGCDVVAGFAAAAGDAGARAAGAAADTEGPTLGDALSLGLGGGVATVMQLVVGAKGAPQEAP
jgi:hypothetical protein